MMKMVTKEFTRNVVLKRQLRAALVDTRVSEMIKSDFSSTFHSIGLGKEGAHKLATAVMAHMAENNTLRETEGSILTLFEGIEVDGKSFLEVLKQRLDERQEKIVDQVTPFVRGIRGKIIDFGAGNGGVAQKVHDRYGLDVEAIDVADFRSRDITVPFLRFENGNVPVNDGYYAAAILITVMHHEANNERILRELTRIVRNKLVVIETSPIDSSLREWQRTFANDVLWNRFFNYANIPVPGTYESAEGWINRFARHGWEVSHNEPLEYDQATAKVFHHLLVFRR
jgi:SAM-dependent methyltransferase